MNISPRVGKTIGRWLQWRYSIPALLFVWALLAVLLRAPAENGATESALRGSAQARGDAHLTQLADSHQRGEDVHEINVAEEKALHGHDVAFSAHPDHNLHSNHLIVVAGHAVVRVSELARAATDDAAWWLLKYQRGQGFPSIISSHVRKGLQLAQDDPKSLLVFSGGQTRKDVGPISEAASYYYLADSQGWIPPQTATTTGTGPSAEDKDKDTQTYPVRDRVYLDEFARDSFENLLFSLCRYREVTGNYPSKVSVVGFDFKEARFVDQHRAALGFPAERFSYVGLTPVKGSGFNHIVAEAGEEKIRAVFEKDPYGCTHVLSYKRELRNPFRRSIPYEEACPELHALVRWCGPEAFGGMSDLPWAEANGATI